jgi:hypothetical protein
MDNKTLKPLGTMIHGKHNIATWKHSNGVGITNLNSFDDWRGFIGTLFDALMINMVVIPW